ncbi:tetratricopeptide repeat protein [Amycolatopsis taiwanensis]|uniref:Preprotein translocase SecA n=1 Tax=Amycolatopsis taiwanensis TaxID=342230 RepID=A0A9W6R8A7_9PSEU|nr:tetratricopeptide repeat protein [Amycolatopsis taiwanensis]GLY70904.1 preprotein translocase SecA [Amycolatopsis taiwanensis]
MPTDTEAAEIARELEAQVDDFPDERGEILIEAAESWRRAGDHERAIELLTEVLALGGEDSGSARVMLADVLFDLDRVDEARAQLDALRRERPSSPAPYHLAAELVESRDDLDEALTWFNMAVARLTEQEMAQQRGEFGAFSYANNILAGRRRVRSALGLPADELDESVATPAQRPVFNDPEEISDALTGPGPTPREIRVLFWPRDELRRAHETWPQVVQHTDADSMVRDRELANRELSDAGVARITMVPLTVAKLTQFAARAGGDPTDEATRGGCMQEIVAEGGAISWPPARNAPCWCGSRAKYKKCCGLPHLD